ncbi:ATP-binding protein [Lutibacter citreus]|uniref:ATP-binding protein n=1 Tax=Lutibacter citreus TaxID=2138210 RepID=UPI000DBEAB0B|nr:SbcC/MukB-like Walker B domain-containing protein [Lutibacter citreus]
MYSLFSTSSDKAGFRLQYMEVYNWGTFDKQIFKISPLSNNSLLTGANGSGKTTYIDALLTLLVPSKKDRFYNQSSGVEKKGDRDEESYVLGHYGDIQKEGELSSTTQMLRNKKSYSVILACFANTDQKTVTLFQVRWFSGGVLKRSFGIAHQSLNIENDFFPFDSKGNWKKLIDKIYNSNSLKKKVEFFEGPTKYAERMVILFGMKSSKALSLFNQVVGIKVLGDLDEFIRVNMLEWRDAENEYIQLKESFVTLMDAKNNIDKAKEQIKQLEPINNIANQLEKIEGSIKNLKADKEISVFWFSIKGKNICEKEIEVINAKLVLCDAEIEKLKAKEIDLKEEETDLSVQIKSDEVGKQISELSKEILRFEKLRDTRKNKLDNYNSLSQKLSLPTNPNKEVFLQTRETTKIKKAECKHKEDALRDDLRKIKNQQDEIEFNVSNGLETVKILQQNKNNISGRVAQIREEILLEIGATKEEIPFIAELININDSEKEWESSIEKVLHNFSLQLIVPEKYYHQVNKYVNNINLKGKINYQCYRQQVSLLTMQSISFDKKYLINKISFKPNNLYTDWIEEKIIQQFNYICADNLEEFNVQEKAITKKGLVKFGKGRHEKDDRKHIISKENYILGWDNKEKLEWWKKELKLYQLEQKENLVQLRKIDKSINEIEELQDDYSELFKLYTKFDEIDWLTFAKEIKLKQEQRTKLEKANDKVRVLQEQLKETKELLSKNGDLIDEEKDTKSKLKISLDDAESQLANHLSILNVIEEINADLVEFEFENKNLLNINYSNFEVVRASFQTNNSLKLTELNKNKSNLKEEVIPKISAFKNPSESISSKYKSWRSDVSSLPEKIEFISEYQDKYKDLIEEGLIEFENRFNKYLEDTITDKVGGFNMFFQNWGDDIKKNIDSLNDALREIEFKNSPKTYIQLIAQFKTSDEIKEFKNLLHNAIPNFKEIDSSIDGKKVHFENHIEPLIKKLEDEKWRNKAMEVRSWFEYKAEEFYLETNQKFKTYSGMGQLSGGEKAQLTYTILGSAIAYQFGLTKEGLQTNSFRFIAIDEAFKAQDEDKAQYLMKLCKQLHLQLLVVTPSDNIHIVEPHISFVHFVERKNDRNSWLYDMPIKQFQEEREKYVVGV